MEDLLQTAIDHHRRGHLRDAGRLYQAALRREPDHPDALHLLGVVAHQLGQGRAAAELIGRAVALRPEAPEFHADLADVWRALGRFDEAARCGREALRLRPAYPEAANNLGLALLDAGDAAGAIASFRNALAFRPDFALAHLNLADALRGQGRVDEAIAHLRLAVRSDPELAEAHSNLGQCLAERGERAEALRHCQQAVTLRPDLAEAHCNLGNVLRDVGRLDEARHHYDEALRLAPHHAQIAGNIAQLLQEEGRLDEALSWYERALALDPGSPRLRCHAADALIERDRLDDAAVQCEAALQLDSRCAEAHIALGAVRHGQGRDAEAKAHLQAALERNPNSAAAHSGLGIVLEEQGDLHAAQTRFRAARQHDPDHAGALVHLATMLRGKLPEPELAALRGLLAGPDQRDGRRAALHFALAQVLDARGDYAEAAAQLDRANALALAVGCRRGETYDPERHAEFVAAMIATCDPAFFERVRELGLDSERPVFVFGLPRSGTTLIEQVLAGHSQVFGAGELPLVPGGFESLPAAMRRVGESPMACLSRLDRGAIEVVGRRYLDGLRALDSTAPRVVDKLPDNYLYLGMLAALFPKARFIHCRRDLRDVAVSCWMTNFRRIRWANDRDHIAARFAAYSRLMEHWRSALPVPVLEVAYEDTVADLEGVARRLMAWCGLDWEPSCLEFHRAGRPVRTASVSQVRQPLYTRSVARWKHYEPALGPLFTRLGVASGDRPS